MANSLAIFDHIDSSNLPAKEKSMIARLVEKAMPAGAITKGTREIAHQGGHVVLQNGIAGVTGSLLGFIHAESPTGLDIKGAVPLDLVASIAGAAGAMITAGEPVAAFGLRNAGSHALAIFTFRKSHAFIAAKKAASGQVAGGGTLKAHGEDDGGESDVGSDFGNDSIVATARRLDQSA